MHSCTLILGSGAGGMEGVCAFASKAFNGEARANKEPLSRSLAGSRCATVVSWCTILLESSELNNRGGRCTKRAWQDDGGAH